MQKLVTSLWINDCAEDPVNFYLSIFNDARIKRLVRYSEAGPEPAGKVMTIDFQLEGQDFLAINSSVDFPCTPAISRVVNCRDQAEIDALWKRLAAAPDSGQCGWVEDKFGLSWQIVTPQAVDPICSQNPAKAAAVTRAMLGMKKLDLAAPKRMRKWTRSSNPICWWCAIGPNSMNAVCAAHRIGSSKCFHLPPPPTTRR
ncbi:MAG: VOC family protein [Thiotrichales bacterium]